MRQGMIGTFFPLLILVSSTASAFESIDTVRKAAANYVASQLPGATVEAAALDNRLRIADCAQDLRTATFGTPANASWTVSVTCRQPAWTLYVPVHIRDQRKVLIATRNLRAGEILAADALSLELRDTARMPSGYISDAQAATGKVLRQPVAAGTALTPDMLGGVLSIRRGQTVTVLSRIGAIEVRAQGKALTDGATGDLISVENDSSRRVVQGRVTVDGDVEVTS
jgi:flagella basal body P-ring formation protein FlgA